MGNQIDDLAIRYSHEAHLYNGDPLVVASDTHELPRVGYPQTGAEGNPITLRFPCPPGSVWYPKSQH